MKRPVPPPRDSLFPPPRHAQSEPDWQPRSGAHKETSRGAAWGKAEAEMEPEARVGAEAGSTFQADGPSVRSGSLQWVRDMANDATRQVLRARSRSGLSHFAGAPERPSAPPCLPDPLTLSLLRSCPLEMLRPVYILLALRSLPLALAVLEEHIAKGDPRYGSPLTVFILWHDIVTLRTPTVPIAELERYAIPLPLLSHRIVCHTASGWCKRWHSYGAGRPM